ncbi:MAG: SHOCT domain-containing protein [Vicinamibacterales bacterium]|nr:SHOCT domain-containing protein [Vicinamibacterales bacterium]
MFDKLKSLARKAKDTVSSTAVLVGDLNGDGKVDEEDARIAAEWTKKTSSSLCDEVGKLGKGAIRSDLAKDAASGAAIGAVVAIPVPIIGPMVGAAIGAGLGVFKNFTKTNQPSPVVRDHASSVPKDVHAELLKLYDLMQKGIISEVEFEAQKKKILSAST